MNSTIKKIMKIFCFLFIIFISTEFQAQEKFICKTWKKSFELIDGKREKFNTKQENIKITFFENHSMEYFEEKEIIKGEWELDFSKKTLIFIIAGAPKKFILNLVKLSEDELIVERKDEKSKKMKRLILVPIP